MIIISSTNVRAVARLLDRRPAADPAVRRRVARIVEDVRRHGDRALRRHAERLDRLEGALELSAAEIDEGARRAPRDLVRALGVAARHIRRIARRQLPASWRCQVTRGVRIEQRVVPLDRVGCYVPGGRYPLPSSLLMTAVPARVAGVAEIVAVCPRPVPAVLAAAREAGVTRLFRIGGAQAIAALAYGTPSVPQVDKIVGPGNRYVTAAKALVAADCAIDFLAGPSEILVLADGGRPDWIAADLVAQAEHDPDARALLVTSSRRLAERVARRADALAREHPAARPSIARSGIIVTRGAREAIDLANRAAPEHLACGTEVVAREIARAGTVFVGPYSAQAAGDYATGSNHVLPTGGGARFRGGLSAADFVRVSSVQRLTRGGFARLAPSVLALARAEGLTAHAASIEVRLGSETETS